MALKLKGVFSRKSKDKKGKVETPENVNDNGGGIEAVIQPTSEELSPEEQKYEDEVAPLQGSSNGDAKSYCSNSDTKSIGKDHTAAGKQRTAARRAKSRRQLREESKRALNAELTTSSRHSRGSLRSLECGHDDHDDDGFSGGDVGVVISIPGSPHASASSTSYGPIDEPRRRSDSRGRRSRSRDQPLSLRGSEHGQERRDRSLTRPSRREERSKSKDAAARRRKERSKSKDPTDRADNGPIGGHVLNQPEDIVSKSRKTDPPSSNETGAPNCDDKTKGFLDLLQSATASHDKNNAKGPVVIEKVPLNDVKTESDILSEAERMKSELESITGRGRRGKSKDRSCLASSSHQPRSRSIDKPPTRSKSKGSSRDPSGSSSRSTSRDRSSGDRKPRGRSSERRKKRLESGSNDKALKQESMRLLFGEISKTEEETIVAGNMEGQQKLAEKDTSAIADALSAIDLKETADTSKGAAVLEAIGSTKEKHIDHPMKESKEQRRARRSKDPSQRRSTSRDRRPPRRSSKNSLDLHGEEGANRNDSIPLDSKSGRAIACDKSIPRNSSRSSRDKENSGRSSTRSLRLSDHGSQHRERPRRSSLRKDVEANADSRCSAEKSREETAPGTEKQFQTVAVVFHREEEETADSKLEQGKLEMNPLVALLLHAETSEAGVEAKEGAAGVPSTPNPTKQGNCKDTEESHTELSAATTPETAPCEDPKGGTAFESKESNLDKKEADPQGLVKAEKPEGDKDVGERLSEKDRRRAERRARRENQKKECIKTPTLHDGDSNMAALLGLIGSTKEDFEPKQDSSAAIALFDTRPQSSVEFFQSLISPCPSAAAGSPSRSSRRAPETRGVSRSSSDFVKDVSLGRQKKTSSLPKKPTSLRDVLSASEHVKSSRRTAGDEHSLPPPSLAGDKYAKSKKKSNKNGQGVAIKEEEVNQLKFDPAPAPPTSTTKKSKLRANSDGGTKDMFALMDSEQQATGEDREASKGRSRKVRRSNETSKVDDADANESLAPPSLAGNTVYRATGEEGATNQLHAVSEEDEDRSTGTPLQTPLRITPKKATSFAHLALDDNDDDSFADELPSKPKADEREEDDKKKKRSSMMKQMKKASVSTSKVVGKKSKGVMKKATSARNVFGQVATKAFTWGKEDGEGLLKSSG